MIRKSIKLFKEDLCKDPRHWYQNFFAAHYVDQGYPRVSIDGSSDTNITRLFEYLKENVQNMDWDVQGDYVYFTNDSDRTLYVLMFC